MKRKQLIKNLMAAGVQRNDAAAFAKTYRAVKKAGLTHLFQELELPPEPVIQNRTVRPERLRVKCAVDRREMECRGGTIDWDAYMKDRLTRQLAQKLKDAGGVCFYKKANPLWTEFYAEINVLPSDAREVCEECF